jgi:CO dehydrogenase/acetyl-CoA synthase gamma subunit (corrinoid Fe-S protein)
MREMFPDYGRGAALVLLDLEVVGPAVVRVEGIWADPYKAFVVTADAFCVCSPTHDQPVALTGENEASVLRWNGPVDSTMFRIGARDS